VAPAGAGSAARKPKQWEYKVTVFPVGNDEANNRLNELADHGGEYVGLVGTGRGTAAPGHAASVVFRRLKK